MLILSRNILQEMVRTITNRPANFLHLYTNDRWPTAHTAISSLKPPPISDFYNPISLVGENWQIYELNGACVATYPKLNFYLTSNTKVYGYFVADDLENLIYAERFAAPFTKDLDFTLEIGLKITIG